MSQYTVGDLKDGVAGLVSGTNLDKVTNLYKVFERAARKLVQMADVPEATEKVALTLYGGVYDYQVSEKIFGGALIDIQPQGVTRWYGEDVQKMPIALFDRTKQYNRNGIQATFEYKNGTPTIRIVSARANALAYLDTMRDDDGWVAAGSASALAEDTTVYYETPASLRFTLTGSSTGTLTKTLDSAVDLSSYENAGVAFLALRLPDGATATELTSVELRVGSDDSNYDSVTATEGFLGAWTVGSWLLVAFDMSTSSSTGTPDWENIDYVQARFAHTGTFTNIRVGGLWLALPSPHEIIYQTSAIFWDGSTRSRTIHNTDSTYIVLGDAAFTLYEHECALGVAIQTVQNKKADEIRKILYGGEDTVGLYARYRGDNPSQELRTVGTYYDT